RLRGPPLLPYTTLFRSLGSLGIGTRDRVGQGPQQGEGVSRRVAPVGKLGDAGQGSPLGVDQLPNLGAGSLGLVAIMEATTVKQVDRKSTRLNSSHVKIS